MASLYTKEGSARWWLRYKSAAGKWKGQQLKYRTDNAGDTRQAKLVARRQSEIEAARTPVRGSRLTDWVLPWIIDTYGNTRNTTPDVYKRMWRRLEGFLETKEILTANQVEREFIGDYLKWRTGAKGHKAGRNQAIQEIKFMGMVLKEAVKRRQILSNPLEKPGLKKDATAEKLVWSDEDMAKAARHLGKHGSRWMRAAFGFGLYQACRLRQCQLPIRAIRFDLNAIQYPDALVKGCKGYSQPIDPQFRPILEQLVAEAVAAGDSVICKVPWDASLRFRKAFDRAGLPGLCHHGLRHTWITRAAEKGIPESQAMAFCHHQSAEVHRIYKHLSLVGIQHVPLQMNSPKLAALSGRADSRGARRDSASPSLSSRTQNNSPGQYRRKSSGGRSRQTAQVP